jgi:hypothetical protein
MIASQCSFEQMMQIAAGNPDLANATSFMQVEHGVSELMASWDGFVDTSDHYKMTFKSRKDICNNFANALAEYIQFLEPTPNPLGQTVSENS